MAIGKILLGFGVLALIAAVGLYIIHTHRPDYTWDKDNEAVRDTNGLLMETKDYKCPDHYTLTYGTNQDTISLICIPFVPAIRK